MHHPQQFRSFHLYGEQFPLPLIDQDTVPIALNERDTGKLCFARRYAVPFQIEWMPFCQIERARFTPERFRDSLETTQHTFRAGDCHGSSLISLRFILCIFDLPASLCGRSRHGCLYTKRFILRRRSNRPPLPLTITSSPLFLPNRELPAVGIKTGIAARIIRDHVINKIFVAGGSAGALRPAQRRTRRPVQLR